MGCAAVIEPPMENSSAGVGIALADDEAMGCVGMVSGWMWTEFEGGFRLTPEVMKNSKEQKGLKFCGPKAKLRVVMTRSVEVGKVGPRPLTLALEGLHAAAPFGCYFFSNTKK